MNITNHYVLIKPEETIADTIAEICDDCCVGPNEPFAFSAILTPDKNDESLYKLKINCISPPEENPYTPTELVRGIYFQEPRENNVRYIQPALDEWLRIFQPLLSSLVSQVHPRYEQLIPNRDELLSTLYLVVMRLYNQGYYLHRRLIKTSFINELNMECRELLPLQKINSLDAPIGEDDDGKTITLLDQIPAADAWARNVLLYTDTDRKRELFATLKARMLEDMSPLQFERILIQLKTNTVDRSTSYKLDRYRQIFNPGYVPRPNAKGKNRGGKKIDKQ